MPWGVAAAAVGAAGSIAAADKGSSTTTKDPKYLTRSKRDLVKRSGDLSERQYESYGGQRVAGISDNEQSAVTIAGQRSPEARSYFEKAGEQVGKSALDYNGDNLDQYMNPYIENVLQPQLREQNKAYETERTRLGNLDDEAFGGDRAALRESALEQKHMQSISDITGKTYGEAWDRANQIFFSDSARHAAAADSYARLGQGIQALDTNDIQNLMATGGLERLLKQAGLDQQYADYLEQRDWDVNNLDILIKGISAAQGNAATTTTNSSQAWQTAANSVIGAGATLAGMYFTGNKGLSEVSTSGLDAYRVGGSARGP